MPQSDMKIFAESINKEAERQKKRIETETEKYVEQELAKAKKDANAKALAFIGKETGKILAASGLDITKKNVEANNMLFMRRKQILDEVNTSVKEKIAVFTSSEVYGDFLVKSAAAISENLDESKIAFFLRPDDMKFAALLKDKYPDCTVEADGEIILGGLKAKDGSGRILLNDTLDMRFEEQKKKFRRTTELIINKS